MLFEDVGSEFERLGKDLSAGAGHFDECWRLFRGSLPH